MSLLNEYESFLRLNGLEISTETANLFLDMIDTDYVDLYVIVDSYLEKVDKLKTIKAQINNLQKALKILPERIVTRLELARRIMDRYGSFDPRKYFTGYSDDYVNINYLQFIEAEIEFYNKKYEEDRLSENEYNDYILAHRGAIYTFVFFDDYEKALFCALKEISIDEKDKFDIVSIIPYLYLSLNEFDEFKTSLNHKEMNDLTYHLTYSIYYLMTKNEEKALSELRLAKDIDSDIFKIIANPSYKDKLDEKSMARYYYEHYTYLRLDIIDLYKKFVIKNINEIESLY